jgi:HAD superfamily hydrolase (TIGR01484 family)
MNGAIPRPAPLADLSAKLCRDLAFLFTDIDDTITTDGRIPAASYAALWDLHDAGIHIVPVTGRPAGWCDMIARMWPVHGVVGENGAFYYAYDRRLRLMRRRSIAAGREAADRETLAAAAARVLREVPGTALAADQAFRACDMAIDYCEDVPPLPPEAVRAICRILSEQGMRCKVSSIHVNFWRGDFDKMAGVGLYLEHEEGLSLAAVAEKALFVGDSPNDEPLFAGFPHTIAVGNLRRFLDQLRHLPEFITEADCGAGFAEAARAIIAKRALPAQ